MSVLAAVEAMFAGDSDVTIIDAAVSPVEFVSRIRAATTRFVLVVVGPDLSPVDRAMILAGIGPLAVELGPERRIGALDIGADARREDILDSARFLAGAESSTGQMLAVNA